MGEQALQNAITNAKYELAALERQRKLDCYSRVGYERKKRQINARLHSAQQRLSAYNRRQQQKQKRMESLRQAERQAAREAKQFESDLKRLEGQREKERQREKKESLTRRGARATRLARGEDELRLRRKTLLGGR